MLRGRDGSCFAATVLGIMWEAASHGTPQVAAPRRFLILADSVRVEASLTDTSVSGHWNFDVLVSRGDRRFTSTTEIMAEGLTEAVRHLRRTTGWKEHCLFVRDEGIGNRWKQIGETVFMIRHGRLVELGRLPAKEGDAPGGCLRGGYFRDIYDDLEEDFICHACSPFFSVFLQERDGVLVPDLERTWVGNMTEFQRAVADARASVRPGHHITDRNDLLIPRVEAASIAFYCRQNRALEAIRAEARAVLHPDELESFAEEVAKITPGEVPENTRPETSAAP